MLVDNFFLLTRPIMKQTMEQEKRIRELMVENENLAAHFRRVSKQGYELHRMDVDVMLSKTRQLYDHLLALQAQLPATTWAPEPEPDPGSQPQAEPPSKPETTPIAQAEPEPDTVDDHMAEGPVDATSETDEAATEFAQTPHTTPKEAAAETRAAGTDDKEAEEQEPADEEGSRQHDEKTEAATNAQSQARLATIDLFSQDAPESLGEKLAPNQDHSIAARMQQSPIKDLREAIGINEKFLFINELFKGNLNQYNKSIDELNAFESINGAFTCLIELKVQHQWDENGSAFKKLKELIERKYKQG